MIHRPWRQRHVNAIAHVSTPRLVDFSWLMCAVIENVSISRIPHFNRLSLDLATPLHKRFKDIQTIQPSSEPPPWNESILAYSEICFTFPALLKLGRSAARRQIPGFKILMPRYWSNNGWVQTQSNQVNSTLSITIFLTFGDAIPARICSLVIILHASFRATLTLLVYTEWLHTELIYSPTE